MQITKLESEELDVITVYRWVQGKSTELLEQLKNLVHPEKATVLCGDFNICYTSNRNNKVTQWLENNKFSQLMKEATHIRGRLLDHLYFKPVGNILENPSIHRYSPFYSDHNAICAAISTKGSFSTAKSNQLQLWNAETKSLWYVFDIIIKFKLRILFTGSDCQAEESTK